MADYKKTGVAQNICGEQAPCVGFISPVEAALACTPVGRWDTGGWPRAGGRVQFQLWSDICPPSPNPSLNICFSSPLYIAMCAARPEQNKEYDPTKFITSYSYFSTKTSTTGTASQFRASAVITNSNINTLNVALKIEYLNEDGNESSWVNYLQGSQTLQLQGTYVKNQGLAYKSNPEFIPVTPAPAGPNCQVKYLSMLAGLEPLKFGCGIKDDLACAMFDGDSYLFCFRGEIIDKNNTYFPKPFLAAFNRGNCGATGFAYCGCDNCVLETTTSYQCQYNEDPAFIDYLYTGYSEPVDKRQDIQIASDTYPLEIMVKYIEGSGLYFYWRNLAISQPWQRSSGSIVQAYGPTIYKVEDSDWIIYFYNTKFPSPEIVVDCTNPPPYTTTQDEVTMSQLNFSGIDDEPVTEPTQIQKLKQRYEIKCIHLGEQLEATPSCGCAGAPKFACALFGECRRYGNKNDTKVCSKCDKYEPRPPQ